MTERLKRLLDLLPEHIRTLSPAKLFVLLGLLGAVLAVGLVALLWRSGGGTEQQILYTQLSIQDAGAITTKLRDMGVAYMVKGDGTTIMVPAPMVYDLRLRLATEGLPQGGGVGFEVFDQRSFGMTEFMQKLNYQRALQGELARSITQLTAVQNARVHIVLPEKSLFVGQQEKTTASVMLQLVPGRRLSQEQIRGIVHLVSSSVEGLAPADVTVVDSSGQILNRQDASADKLSHTEAQLTHQQTIEQGLERRIQSMLERAVGDGKVTVRVSATLDFQHIERTEERFDGDNPAIRSEQRSKEEGQGPGYWVAGVPGVRPNVETTAPEQDANKAKAISRQSETVNYEISKTVSKIVVSSGDIKHLSVAVLVDGVYQPGEKKGERKYVPRTPEELAKFREIVKGAMGYNEARGDRVEVANVPFENRETLEEGVAKETQRLFMRDLIRYGAYVILGLLLFLFVGRPLVKWLTGSPKTSVVATTELPRTVREMEADMGVAAMLPTGEEPETAAPKALKIGKPFGQALRNQIADFVRAEPERAVEILRVWLRG
jgi:flagellar M-ring protein FliF